MGEPMRRLILASSSPRRRRLLEEAGFEFEVHVPRVDETAREGESAEMLAQRLAREKARAICDAHDDGVCVLGADTVVVLDHDLLGKPRDAMEAVDMLTRIAGRAHRVLTGWAIARPETEAVVVGVDESRVHMRPVRRDEAHGYAATGEPLDKAGGYALQGIGGRFVERVEGSRSNVIGLPLESVVPRLEALGVQRVRPG